VVVPELGFFEVQEEGFPGDPVEFGKPAFGKAPEVLNAVDVRAFAI